MTDYKATPLIDREMVTESKELMGEKFAMLVGYFLEDSTMYVGQVEQAYERAETEGVVPPAHTLKSSARQMGAARMSALAESIEHGARDLLKQGGELRTLEPCVRDLKGVLAETLIAYREFS